MEMLDGGKVALRGGNQNNLCADEGNTIKCDRDRVGGWEKFAVGVLTIPEGPAPNKPMVTDGSRRPQPPPTPYKPMVMDGSGGRPTVTGLDGVEKKAETAEKDRAAAVATTVEDKQNLYDAKEKEAKAKQDGDNAKAKDDKAETDANAEADLEEVKNEVRFIISPTHARQRP